MKKYISLFLCLTCILTLVACGKKAAPIQLPQTSDITSVDVTVGENTTNHSDTAWISEIISDISSSEPTSKQSVQDFPQTESYIKIDFQFETGTSTIFHTFASISAGYDHRITTAFCNCFPSFRKRCYCNGYAYGSRLIPHCGTSLISISLISIEKHSFNFFILTRYAHISFW